MLTDLWVYELGDAILLAMERDVKDTVLARLDQFIFSEDVALGDVTDTFAAEAVLGPAAASIGAAVLDGIQTAALTALPEHGNLRAQFRGHAAIVLRVGDLGEPGYELLVEREQHIPLRAAIVDAGAVAIDEGVANVLRVEAGVPRFGVDMDDTTIPLEAGIQDRALSMTKGCYVGQEVIVRVLHRGHGRVARKLVGLALEGASAPAAGAVVRDAGHDVGHVTSAVMSVALGKPIALAYVRRESAESGRELQVGDARAVVTPLPFVTSAA
jgi:folate-binding protein YgfZ